jgi:hypothetical protein
MYGKPLALGWREWNPAMLHERQICLVATVDNNGKKEESDGFV